MVAWLHGCVVGGDLATLVMTSHARNDTVVLSEWCHAIRFTPVSPDVPPCTPDRTTP